MHAKRSEAVGLGRELEEVKEQICNLRSELAKRNLERAGVDKELQLLRARLAERADEQHKMVSTGATFFLIYLIYA